MDYKKLELGEASRNDSTFGFEKMKKQMARGVITGLGQGHAQVVEELGADSDFEAPVLSFILTGVKCSGVFMFQLLPKS